MDSFNNQFQGFKRNKCQFECIYYDNLKASLNAFKEPEMTRHYLFGKVARIWQKNFPQKMEISGIKINLERLREFDKF